MAHSLIITPGLCCWSEYPQYLWLVYYIYLWRYQSPKNTSDTILHSPTAYARQFVPELHPPDGTERSCGSPVACMVVAQSTMLAAPGTTPHDPNVEAHIRKQSSACPSSWIAELESHQACSAHDL